MRKEKETLWTKVENYCIDVQALPAAKEQEITKIGKLAQRYVLPLKNSNSTKSLITKMTRSSTARYQLWEMYGIWSGWVWNTERVLFTTTSKRGPADDYLTVFLFSWGRAASQWFGGRMEEILVQPKTKLMTLALNLDFFFTLLSGKKSVKR